MSGAGAHPTAPEADALPGTRAVRENLVYSWLKNQHGFESPSIFESRGPPVTKKIIYFPRELGEKSKNRCINDGEHILQQIPWSWFNELHSA